MVLDAFEDQTRATAFSSTGDESGSGRDGRVGPHVSANEVLFPEERALETFE